MGKTPSKWMVQVLFTDLKFHEPPKSFKSVISPCVSDHLTKRMPCCFQKKLSVNDADLCGKKR